MALSFDTCFLIDLERERKNTVQGPAHQFLAARGGEELHLSVTALGEFAGGFADKTHPVLKAVSGHFRILAGDVETAWEYAAVYRDLKSRSQLIGANDLWIAASALRHGLPLVTRNAAEFQRVQRLVVVTY